MTNSHGFCPIHVWEWPQCARQCQDARDEFKKAAEALRKYWWQWRHGHLDQRVPRTEQCAWCHGRFRTVVYNQRFCSAECRRKARWVRRSVRLANQNRQKVRVA